MASVSSASKGAKGKDALLPLYFWSYDIRQAFLSPVYCMHEGETRLGDTREPRALSTLFPFSIKGFGEKSVGGGR